MDNPPNLHQALSLSPLHTHTTTTNRGQLPTRQVKATHTHQNPKA